MPTSSDQLRKEFGFGEGNDGIFEAETVLKKEGIKVDNRYFIHLPIDASDRACDAAQFLREEWDYGIYHLRGTKVKKQYKKQSIVVTIVNAGVAAFAHYYWHWPWIIASIVPFVTAVVLAGVYWAVFHPKSPI